MLLNLCNIAPGHSVRGLAQMVCRILERSGTDILHGGLGKHGIDLFRHQGVQPFG